MKSASENIENQLVIHHIGGRNGTIGVNIPKIFLKESILVIYDADNDSLKDIEEKIENLYGKSIVLPYCIGGNNGTTSFHVNKDPFTSSNLATNTEFSDYYFFVITMITSGEKLAHAVKTAT